MNSILLKVMSLIWVALMPQVRIPGPGGVHPAAPAGCTGTSPTGCILRETFEGATACWSGSSYTNCDSGSWVNMFAGANAVYNYATSPAPLQGANSLRLVGSSVVATLPFTATDSVYVGTMFNFAAFADFNTKIRVADSSNTELCGVEIPSATTIFYLTNAGGTSQSSASGIATGTTYYIQIKAVKGTGTNSACSLLYSTTGTAGSWTTLTSTNGTWTTSPSRFYAVSANAASGAEELFDDIRMSATEISWH